jgi:protein-disulfide isomerase
MRVARLVLLGGLVALAGCGGSSQQAAAPQQTGASENTQLVSYYRKKANVPPSQKVTVVGLKDAAIGGVKEGNLQIGDGPSAQSVPFTQSADGRYAIFAAVEDVTADPGKAVMQKISLKGEPSKGPADAKVTIVEYSDFQCPFCSRGYNTMEKQVLPQYADKVRFYYKHYPLPFHPWAEAGAVAAECAKQQKPDAYWKVYSGLFENQGQISADNVKAKATEFMADTGVDMNAWNDCYDNKKSLPQVKAQMAEGSSVGVRGTPGFIINGRLVSGAQPFESFKNIIDDELASAM